MANFSLSSDISKENSSENSLETSSVFSHPESQPTPLADRSVLKSFSAEALAQALAEQLMIRPNDWHRLSANRSARAREQAAAALVYLLKDQPEEALPRLAQAVGWLDKTLKAPPCPTHSRG